MALPRQSLSSGHSRDSTAIDPQSPKMLDEHEKERMSSDDQTTKPASIGATSDSSPIRSLLGTYEPGERHGWPLLAEVMSEVPEYAAFRRFRDLNAKNLLYYQVQLANLREEILKEEDQVPLHDDLQRYGVLAEKANTRYHKLMLELRQLLREYNEAVLQHTKISSLPDPEAYNMRSLRSWLQHPEGGCYGILNKDGLEKTWGDPTEEEEPEPLWTQARKVIGALLWAKPPLKSDCDLVVTNPEVKIDGLTKWTVYYLIPFYWSVKRNWQARGLKKSDADEEKPPSLGSRQGSVNQPSKKSAHKTLESFSELSALRFTSGLSTVVACLIPVIAIAVLTQVSGIRDLLLTITGFAVVFAILLIFLTQGTTSRTEIFAATAAFSAVLVVFISQPAINIQMPPGSETPVINL